MYHFRMRCIYAYYIAYAYPESAVIGLLSAYLSLNTDGLQTLWIFLDMLILHKLGRNEVLPFIASATMYSLIHHLF
jgi:hypothetical protein